MTALVWLPRCRILIFRPCRGKSAMKVYQDPSRLPVFLISYIYNFCKARRDEIIENRYFT